MIAPAVWRHPNASIAAADRALVAYRNAYRRLCAPALAVPACQTACIGFHAYDEDAEAICAALPTSTCETVPMGPWTTLSPRYGLSSEADRLSKG
jgi:hypothetical protein